jgi:hypothetical protein
MWEHNPTVEHHKNRSPPSDIIPSLFPILCTLLINFLKKKKSFIFILLSFLFPKQPTKNYLHKELTPRSGLLLEKPIIKQQVITRSLWNSKIYYRIYNSLPAVPFFNMINSVHIFSSYFLHLLILFSHLCLGLPSGLFLSFFQPKSCMCFCSLPNVWHTRPPYSPSSDQNKKLFGDEYKSCSSR